MFGWPLHSRDQTRIADAPLFAAARRVSSATQTTLLTVHTHSWAFRVHTRYLFRFRFSWPKESL